MLFSKQLIVVAMMLCGILSYAQSGNTKSLVASKTYPDVYQDWEQTFASLYSFSIPQRINVTSGNAGTGTILLTFNYSSSGLVTCTYTASADGTYYALSSAPQGLTAQSIVTTDYIKLHVTDGNAAAGQTTVSVILPGVTVSKYQIAAPFPRRYPAIQGQSNLRVGPEQNCATAISLCYNTYMSSPDAYSLQGNEINSTTSCLRTGEINGVWYEFTASVNGVLNFTIIPNVSTDDYDWAVFDLTNASCTDIATNPALQVACNYSGTTAPNGQTGPNGSAGSQYSTPIAVVKGNTYRIFVSYYNSGVALTATQGAGHGFGLNLGASTANLFSPPTVIVSASPQTICQGASTVLTATGAGAGATYTWSPPAGLSSTSGTVVTATPQSTTYYQVTGQTAGGCPFQGGTTVNVNQSPNLIVSPASISSCTPSPKTITASGAWNYSWSNTPGIISTNYYNSITVNPSVTTTYTVTGINGPCTQTKSVTVTVGAPVITITPSATSICTGASSTLTASGADTYTWSPATGLNTTTGAIVTATPATATTYTVTGLAAGCSATKTVTIIPTPCSGCQSTPISRYSKISATQGNLNTTNFSYSGGVNFIGRDVTSIGDFDGDGIEDILVSAAYNYGGFAQGSVHILLLNTNGTVKSQVDITEGLNGFVDPVPHTEYNFHPFSFGAATTWLGDIDGPGGSAAAMVVGVPKDDDGSQNYYNVAFGAVYVIFLNANGTVMKSQKISSTQGNFTGVIHGSVSGNGAYMYGIDGDSFGESIEYLGDLDGAGPSVAAIAIGADGSEGTIYNTGPNYKYSNNGAVFILYLGIDGKVLSNTVINSDIAPLKDIFRFGRDVQNLGDLDGSGPGALTLAVTSASDIYLVTIDNSGNYLSHTLFNLSLPVFGSIQYTNYHHGLATLGDMDGAGPGITTVLFGYGDIVYLANVGAGNTILGHYKIGNGYLGLSLDPNTTDLGMAISAVGDLNNDNIPELAVTSPYDVDGLAPGSYDNPGAVYLLSVCSDLFTQPYMREADNTDLAEVSTVTVSPNPSSSVFQIQLPEDETLVEIEVINLEGQKVQTLKDLTIGNDLRAGMYILTIKTNKGTYFQKIIKE
jgi:hypothetical protein